MQKKETIFLVLISLLVALCPYIYPIEGDDFIYSFTLGPDDKRVVDFSSLLEGVSNCAQVVNGRTFCNFMVFLFVNLIPQWGMYILAFATMLLTFFMIAKRCSAPIVLPVLLTVFWTLCPDIQDALMWKSGFMNYALPGMANLLFLWLFSKTKSINGISSCLLPFFAFWAGSLHEGASLPICAALALYCLFNISKLNRNDLFLIIPYFIGTLTIILTPGTFARVGMSGSHSLHLMTIVKALPSVASVILLCVLQYINRKKSNPAAKTKSSIITRFSLFFGLLFFLFLVVTSGVPEPRYFYFVHLFAVILIAEQLAQIKFLNNTRSFVVFSLLSVISVSISLYKVVEKHYIVSQEMELFASTTDYVVPADVTDLTSDTTSYSNHLIATYFHKPYLIAYPSDAFYHIYLREDAPTSTFSDQWKQVSENKFARVITDIASLPEVKVTKIIDLPLLNKKKFVSSQKGKVMQAKSGTYYQIVSIPDSYSKIISIE